MTAAEAYQVEAARNPEKGGLYSDLPTPRWTCLKRLSGLHLPRFEIRVFLLLDGFCLKRLSELNLPQSF